MGLVTLIANGICFWEISRMLIHDSRISDSRNFVLRLMGHRFYLCLISVWINYVKLPRTSHAHKEILAKRSGQSCGTEWTPAIHCGSLTGFVNRSALYFSEVTNISNCHVHIDGGPGRTVHPLHSVDVNVAERFGSHKN